jgi:hypothetical protein
MADNTNKTDTGNVPKMTDTRTRKTLKLKPLAKGGFTPKDAQKAGLGAVVDPLTQRDTETGPLSPMEDTRTRKTVKLKPLKSAAQKPSIAVDAASKKPGMMEDTRTRKTLKLKPLEKKAVGLTAEALAKPVVEEKASAINDETIKIKRPPKKAGLAPLPSLGATAAEAKTASNKETVKLRPAAAEKATAGAEKAKASKETIKLSPQAEEAPTGKLEETPTVNLKIAPKKNKKSKLTISKPPKAQKPQQAPPKPGEKPAEPAAAGGLKLKAQKAKTEAPRAEADKAKIEELKATKKAGNTEASSIYTLVAILTLVLMAFSALVTAAQYFNLWDLDTIGGKQIEIPYMKDLVK